VNIGNRTSVKSGDILDIEHRTAIWHRYRCSVVGVTRRPGVSTLLVCQCLAHCSTLDRVKHACWARRAFDLRARYPISHVRRQGASDDGVSEVG